MVKYLERNRFIGRVALPHVAGYSTERLTVPRSAGDVGATPGGRLRRPHPDRDPELVDPVMRIEPVFHDRCATQQLHCAVIIRVDRPQADRYGHVMPARPTLDAVFAALADPTRRRILTMLLEDDMAVTDVAEPFEVSLAAISKHLGVLTRAGLISQDKRGRVTWCKLEPGAMRDASVWMQGFGQFEPVDLDAFEAFLMRELASDQTEETENGGDDDDQADEIDDIAHNAPPA
jgi:DNA-binding transcriptional ArsR family regulator